VAKDAYEGLRGGQRCSRESRHAVEERSATAFGVEERSRGAHLDVLLRGMSVESAVVLEEVDLLFNGKVLVAEENDAAL
jgi:hypothetical protein